MRYLQVSLISINASPADDAAMCHELVQSLLLSESAGDMRITVVGMVHVPSAREGQLLQVDLNGGAGRSFKGAKRLTGARML